MTELTHNANRISGRPWAFLLVAYAWITCLPATALAAGYSEGFEGEVASWTFVRNASQAKLLIQERTAENHRTGTRSESLVIETFASDGRSELVHKLPSAVRFDELTASVWVWSNHPGLQAAVRVRLPNQPDQRTGQTLVVEVFGDIHQGGGQWQRLGIDLSDRNFDETMRRVRSDLARRVGIRNANVQGAYVEQISLKLNSNERVHWDLRIDDLELTPVVAPQLEGETQEESTERINPRIRIGDDRVLLDGRPFFPLFVPYHGESLETLEQTNCNVVWVPNYEDHDLLQQLSEAGLGVMATPPQPDLETESPEQAGLLPFAAQTDPILMWMLDVQIPSSRLQQASAWAEMVRDADRQRGRPIMADVMGQERQFHRQLSMVGTSRSIVHTTKTPQIYADTLDQRRRLALPGKPMITLIPTGPAEELISSRPASSSLPLVEPEQLWMQGNIALAAGFKGIGYLTFGSLEAGGIGAEETRRAIEIMNFRIRLLEPWLATAKVLHAARVQIGHDSRTNRSPLLSSWDIRPGTVDDSPEGIAARQIQATVLECDQGLMILLNWLEEHGQYQQGRMVASDVRVLVNRDIVQAIEMTTTGLNDHTLDLKAVPGGTEISLKTLNQSAVILVTTDRQAQGQMNEQLARIRPQVSEAWASLARAKLTRVREVHHRLVKLSPSKISEAEPVLRAAGQYVDQAEKAHKAGRYAEVEDLSRGALAYLRDLQFAHWKNAISRESSPASSPHTICFQTLPDHWQLQDAIQQATSTSENLLSSGNFDDTDSVLVGWTHSSGLLENSPIVTTAALVGPQGASQLHLGAVIDRNKSLPSSIEQTPVTMTSPSIAVSTGQVIRVQGRILIKQPIEGSTDGLLIYDSLAGTVGALRFRDPTPQGTWQDFEFYREVASSGELRLLFELKGLGNVWLDDLQVTAIELPESESLRPQSMTKPVGTP